MSNESQDALKCDGCGRGLLDSKDGLPSRFTATVPMEGISEALLYHVVRGADLPPCQFRGSASLGYREDGTVEAIVKIVWWPAGSPPLPFLKEEEKPNDGP